MSHNTPRRALSVISPHRTLSNAAAVSRYVHGASIEDQSRGDFLAAVSRLQPLSFEWTSDPAEPLVCFAGRHNFVEAAVQHIVADDRITFHHVSPEQEDEVRHKVAAALRILGELDDQVLNAINWCVGSFPYAIVDGMDGGSISSLIGAIWIGLDSEKNPELFGELILHEFVHQSLFLDDMVNGIFIGGEEELSNPGSLVVTAIQQRPRGYDKGFHSAYVALSLYRYWKALGSQSLAEDYIHPTRRTVNDLIERKFNLTDHGQRVLDQLARELEVELNDKKGTASAHPAVP